MTDTTTPPAAASGVGAPSPLTVHLEEFEGPLDLLLHLARTEEIDLARLPIRRITDQYLAYLESVEFRDLDDAGAFLVLAATLVYLKSRLLLPPAESRGGSPRGGCGAPSAGAGGAAARVRPGQGDRPLAPRARSGVEHPLHADVERAADAGVPADREPVALGSDRGLPGVPGPARAGRADTGGGAGGPAAARAHGHDLRGAGAVLVRPVLDPARDLAAAAGGGRDAPGGPRAGPAPARAGAAAGAVRRHRHRAGVRRGVDPWRPEFDRDTRAGRASWRPSSLPPTRRFRSSGSPRSSRSRRSTPATSWRRCASRATARGAAWPSSRWAAACASSRGPSTRRC